MELLVPCERYSEGVVLSPDGDLYYSMTALSTIMAVSGSSDSFQQRVWAYVPGANGHAIAPDGSHVVMSSTGAVVRLDEGGRICAVPITQAAGKPLVYPNDLVMDPHRGGFYVTDSGYKTTPKEIDGAAHGRIIRVDRGAEVSVVAEGIAYANGIGLSPDGQTLYLAESTTRKIWKYRVDGDGTLGDRVLFAEVPTIAGRETVPDGIAISADGSLYIAHYGAGEVLQYGSDGTLARRISSGNRVTSHCALDERHRHAFVSGGIEDESGAGAIFRVDI